MLVSTHVATKAFPRRNVGSGRHLYDEIEGVLAPGALLPNRFGEFGELLRFGEIDREQSVPSSRAPDRAPIGRLTRGERTRSRLGLATVWARWATWDDWRYAFERVDRR